jgi:TetR/AcrR family transcriptional regulator
MSETFEKIPADEQERIRQAALQEFAQNGYRRASTNAIVKAAGIPKGTLFYFFGSKRKLFLYLLDDAIRKYIAFVQTDRGELPRELFERLLAREQVKLRFAAAYPLLFRFFSKVFLDIPSELQEEMESRFREYSRASAQDLMGDLDLSRFREGVDVGQAVDLVHVLLEGIFARYTTRLREADAEELNGLVEEISAECRRYFEMVQEGIYV